MLVRTFRQNSERQFFFPLAKGPRKAPKKNAVRNQVVSLRKENPSICDISRFLKRKSRRLSPVSIFFILNEEGFARLPQREDEEHLPVIRPAVGDAADARKLDFTPRSLCTRFGSLFLFSPFFTCIPFDRLLDQRGLSRSKMVPAGQGVRSLFALKLFGSARNNPVKSHVLVQVRLMTSSLCRMFGSKIRTEYEIAKPREMFRDLADAAASVIFKEEDIIARFRKRGHNALLMAAGLDKISIPIPSLGRKT